MLDAFAHRQDVRVGSAHGVVDLHAAPDGEPRLLGECHVRPDADGHDDQRARDLAPVVEPNALDLVLAENGMGVGLADHLDAAGLDRPLQEIPARRVQLALHQRRHEVENGHLHAPSLEAGRRLQAEQPAADDDRAPAGTGRGDHGIHVVEIAIGHDAGSRWPGSGMIRGLEPVAMSSLS